MTRPALSRWFQVTAILVAVSVVVSEVLRGGTRHGLELLFFAALVTIALFIRVGDDGAAVGFEAAVALAVIPLFHDAAAALVAVFVGGVAYHAWRAIDQRRLRLSPLYDAASAALSYYVVGLLYVGAVARSAPALAKVSGYILLVVGYLLTNVAFTAARQYLADDGVPIDVRAILIAQGRTLVFATPLVAIEILAYFAYGLPGFAVAFLPVLLVAFAMRNEADAARQNGELTRRVRELSILTESATQILSAEGDEETLRRMTTLLGSLSKLKACAIVTWSANPDLPATVYRFGECLPSDQEILRWVDSAGFAQSAPSRAFVFKDDLRRFPLSSGGATQVLIGIQTQEVIYGILIYETEEAVILKTGSLNLLTLLVNQTALSLQDQLLRREMSEKTALLESQAATTTTILDVANSLIGSFDVDAMLTRIALAIRKSLGFEVVVFALYETKRDEFVRRAHAGLDDVWEEVRRKPVSSSEITAYFNQEFRISNSFFISHTALRQSEHGFFVRPEDASYKHDEWHDNDMLIVPLMSADQVIGYLSVREPHDRRLPTMEKVQTLEIFALQAVQALQSARQYDEIKRLTTIDALTPAFNHRYFQEALAREIHRHARTGHEFALAMLDIDNFKRFNDTFGHPVGDDILKGLVEELMTNARDSDIVSRYGGEEFAIVFPDTPASSARDAADRLRALVERREFRPPQLGRTLRITVSVGVSIYPRDGMTSADLIARADAALYFAKKNGKNQVRMAEEVSGDAMASAEY
jgi:diguanylate cyclase (GGDEF)-like protein